MFYDWRRYVPVPRRQAQAARALATLTKKGRPASPVRVEGRAIARTFWGKAWCDNLERYSDFANRLPRGRTYVRNGSVIHLEVAPGAVTALVSGSDIYTVSVKVAPVPGPRWHAICRDCTGGIDSLVELLQGRFSRAVMERLCQERTGLFPSPAEIEFECSCPDWASMCKHVASVLYGVGARLDERPELLFALRRADGQDLITRAGASAPATGTPPRSGRILREGKLSEIFGIDLAHGAAAAPPHGRQPGKRRPVPGPPPAEAAGEPAHRTRLDERGARRPRSSAKAVTAAPPPAGAARSARRRPAAPR